MAVGADAWPEQHLLTGGLDPKAWTTLSHLALLRATFLDAGSGKVYVQGLRDLQAGPISTLETSDGGRTWTTISDDYVQRIPLPWWKGTSLELSGYGLRASNDGGKTWRTVLLSTAYTTFAAGGGARYLTSGLALLRPGDQAGVWTGTPLFDRYLTGLVADPTLADTAYAVMGPRGPGEMPSPVRTSDGGKTWQPFSISVDGQPLMKASIIAIAATTPPALFAAGGDSPVRSVDGGVMTWSRLQLPSRSLIRPAPSDPNVVYASFGLGVIAVSNDGGLDWTFPNLDGPGNVSDLIVDPVDPQILYAVVGGPVAKSTDGGVTWKRSRIFVAQIPHPIALSPARPGTVFYVDALSGDIVETADDGMTGRWHRPPGVVSGLAFDPARPEVLYLSTDAGAFTWVLP